MISSFFGEPTLALVIKNVEEADEGKVIVFDVVNNADMEGDVDKTIEGWEFEQTEVMTGAGVAVHKYGAYIIPKGNEETVIAVTLKYKGDEYVSGAIENFVVGTNIPLQKREPHV